MSTSQLGPYAQRVIYDALENLYNNDYDNRNNNNDNKNKNFQIYVSLNSYLNLLLCTKMVKKCKLTNFDTSFQKPSHNLSLMSKKIDSYRIILIKLLQQDKFFFFNYLKVHSVNSRTVL